MQACESRLQATEAASTELRAQCSRLDAALQQAESSSSVLNDRLAQQLETERSKSEKSAAVAADAQLWRERYRDLEESASHLAEAQSECARLKRELLASKERLQGSALQHSHVAEGMRAERDALEAQLATAAAQLHQREEAEASAAAAQHTRAVEALHAENNRLQAQLAGALEQLRQPEAAAAAAELWDEERQGLEAALATAQQQLEQHGQAAQQCSSVQQHLADAQSECTRSASPCAANPLSVRWSSQNPQHPHYPSPYSIGATSRCIQIHHECMSASRQSMQDVKHQEGNLSCTQMRVDQVCRK